MKNKKKDLKHQLDDILILLDIVHRTLYDVFDRITKIREKNK